MNRLAANRQTYHDKKQREQIYIQHNEKASYKVDIPYDKETKRKLQTQETNKMLVVK